MKARTKKVFPGDHLISQLLNEIAYTYFPMRAAGDEILARFGQTTAEWGLMRSLEGKGPQTVAALARSRPVARPWIQRPGCSASTRPRYRVCYPRRATAINTQAMFLHRSQPSGARGPFWSKRMRARRLSMFLLITLTLLPRFGFTEVMDKEPTQPRIWAVSVAMAVWVLVSPIQWSARL